jgi:type II secretory pathway component PulM
MPLLHKILASLGLLSCLVLAVQMLLKPAQRQRLARRWERLLQAVFERFNARDRRRAAHAAAQDAIERARRASANEGHWEGNVYRPKQFEKRKD